MQFIVVSAFASDQGDWWLQRNVTIGDGLNEYRRINVTSRTAYDAPITKDGITKMERLFKNVVVEDVPSKQKLGKVLLERGKAFKGGIAGVIGGAAITGMIEAVGWVMEEGTYVKYKPIDPDDPTISQYCWTTSGTCSQSSFDNNTANPSVITACDAMLAKAKSTLGAGYVTDKGCSTDELGNALQAYRYVYNSTDTIVKATKKPNPLYDPTKPTQPTKITIKDTDVGGIATGDYSDPVDPKFNITDKKYKPVVPTAYQHDPTGAGEDIANEIDDRIKNAPPTSDGKPAPIGDSRYSTAPQSDTTTNDRSWSEETDTTGEGTTTPVTDPETGEPTGQQSISFKFPVFCEWAFKVCDWYDDWKEFTKDEDLDQEQQQEPDTSVLEQEFDTTFSASGACPPNVSIPFEPFGNLEIGGDKICSFFGYLKYGVLAACSFAAMLIVGAAVRGT